MTFRRRGLFGIGAALIAAPAIVRVSSLMAIKPLQLAPVGPYIVRCTYSVPFLTEPNYDGDLIKVSVLSKMQPGDVIYLTPNYVSWT